MPAPGIPPPASRTSFAPGWCGTRSGRVARRCKGSIRRISNFAAVSLVIRHGLPDNPPRSEPDPVRRDLQLADGRRIHIRPAVPDDAGAVLAYLKQVGGESNNLTFGPEGPGFSEAEEREYLGAVAASDNAVVLLAHHEDTIVGALSFEGGRRPRIRHTGELGISVAESFTGCGI